MVESETLGVRRAGPPPAVLLPEAAELGNLERLRRERQVGIVDLLRGPKGQGVAAIAGEPAGKDRGVEENVEAVIGIAGAGADGDGVRHSAVDVSLGAWRIVEVRKETIHLRHLRGGRLSISALQARESGGEGGEILTVAAPVERLDADDILQRLCDHRALHRVPVAAGRLSAGLVE